MEPQKLQSKAWSASDLVSAASTVVDMATPALNTVLAQEHELLEQELGQLSTAELEALLQDNEKAKIKQIKGTI